MNSSIRKRIILDLVKGISINNVCMKYRLSKQELSNILKDIPIPDGIISIFSGRIPTIKPAIKCPISCINANTRTIKYTSICFVI